MCTLIVLHRCVSGRPLVVAANRDEFLDRPAEDIALRATRTGPILSPLDLEAGGTWVGLSQRGVFAGLTNLRPVEVESESEAPVAGVSESKIRSRGGVVMAALESESAGAAVRKLSKLEEAAYNPFQLLVADGRDAWLVVYRDRPTAIALEPGAHIVGNVEDERIASMLGTSEIGRPGPTRIAGRSGSAAPQAGTKQAFPGFEGIDGLVETEEPRTIKLRRIRERVEKMLTEPGLDLFEGLARICREHVEHVTPARSRESGVGGVGTVGGEEAGAFGSVGGVGGVGVIGGVVEGRAEEGVVSPFEATCVHIADRYGTRSSLLLELSEEPDESRLWTTDGPPCRRPFENRSSLLRDLGVRLDRAASPMERSEGSPLRKDRNDARKTH